MEQVWVSTDEAYANDDSPLCPIIPNKQRSQKYSKRIENQNKVTKKFKLQ